MRFDDLVDHVARTVLHRPASALLLEACCSATDIKKRETIDADHALVQWLFPRFLSVFLDTPDHLRK